MVCENVPIADLGALAAAVPNSLLRQRVLAVTTEAERLGLPEEIVPCYQQLVELLREEEPRGTALWEALIGLHVALDAYSYPSVDPHLGWVALQPEAPAFAIDSQLYHLSFCEGLLGGWELKPQRINLITRQTLQLRCPGATGEGSVSAPEILLRNPGLVRVRFREEVPKATGGRVVVCRDVIGKAGLGAHTQNATSGFVVEYHSDLVCPDLELLLRLALPGNDPTILRAGPLYCMGAVGAVVPFAEGGVLLYEQESPGGLFGVRLLESLSGLTIDLRLSKSMPVCAVRMVTEAGLPQEEREQQEVEVVITLRGTQLEEQRGGLTVFFSVL